MPADPWRRLRDLDAIPLIAAQMTSLLGGLSMSRAQIISDQFLTVVRAGGLEKLIAVAVTESASADPPPIAAAVAVHEPETASATLMFAALLEEKNGSTSDQKVGHVAKNDFGNSADVAGTQVSVGLATALRDDLHDAMKSRGVSFVQWATDPVAIPDDEAAENLQAPSFPQTMGFSFLGTLQYLALTLDNEIQDVDQTTESTVFTPIDWTESADTFGQLVTDTYVDSLDCPDFADFRTADELLHSYRTSPHFCDHGWHWMDADGDRAGVLILSKHNADSDSPVAELTYMGVLAESRGRGLGRIMLEQSIRWARREGCDRIILAVDVDNHPAKRLYEDRGFTPILRETVWGQRLNQQ